MGRIYPGQSATRIGCLHPLKISCASAEWWFSDMVCGCPLSVLTKVSPHLCFSQGHPSWAIKQSEVATTCTGLPWDSQAKPGHESRLTAASAGHGAHWGQLLLNRIRKLWSMSQDQLFIWKSSLGGPIIWAGQSLWWSPSWVKHCWPGWWSLRYGTSLPTLGGEGLEKGQWSLLALMPDSSVSPFMALELRGSESE